DWRGPMKTHPYLSEVSLKPSAAACAQDFPFTLPVVRALDRLAMHPNVTFFVGENGSGKSTLLEAIAVAMGFNRLHGAAAPIKRSSYKPRTRFTHPGAK
ncbi:MAG: family ATPase, partial [Massilia sp.]|nr:family ATPase [Massilia sp.]